MSSSSSLSSLSNISDISFSSFSSSDDEEIVVHRPRIILERNNPMLMYDDIDFKKRFRLTKHMVRFLLDIIGPQIEPNDNRNFPIPAIQKILITLRFYATGSFLITIADNFNVSTSSVSRIVQEVTHYIACQRERFIKLPSNRDELREVCAEFFQIQGFPGVCGAIDCTHVKIQSPGGINAEVFRNRKGWFSINVQAVCDAKLYIREITARWPGSTHDSRIFNNSRLKARLETNEFENCYLLGDSGYACRRYLLTPILNPTTRGEEMYNRAHIATRNPIERTFGIWKRRFPCLAFGLRFRQQTNLGVIVATAVLHNIARDFNGNELEVDEAIENHIRNLADVPLANNNENNNVGIRTALINNTFS